MTKKQQIKIALDLLVQENLPADMSLVDFIESLRLQHDDDAVFMAMHEYLALKKFDYVDWLEPIVYDKLVRNNPAVVPIQYNKDREGFKPYLFVAGFKNRHGKGYLIYNVNPPTVQPGFRRESSFRMAWNDTRGGNDILTSIMNTIMANWSETITYNLYDIVVKGMDKIGVNRTTFKHNPKVTLADMKVDLANYVK